MSDKISKKVNLERQNRYVDRQKAKGMKRLILWVPEEEAEEIKLCTRQPHALAKLRKEVEAEVIATLTKKIERQVYTRIAKKVERSILAQRRSQARRVEVKKNSPPDCIRFAKRPPATRRQALKDAGWVYDIADAIWHLPTDPIGYSKSNALIKNMAEWDPIKLEKPEPMDWETYEKSKQG